MRKVIVLLLVAVIAAGLLWWDLARPAKDQSVLQLYGNVDIRQISLAFTLSERIASMAVEEGDRVEAGQALASLDSQTLQLQIQRTRAAIAAQQQVVQRLQNGSRPQEIAQAQARVVAAEAEAKLAEARLARLQDVGRRTDGQGVSAQDIDSASSQRQAARAQLQVAEQALQLAQIGPRAEDVKQAQAQLQGLQQDLALQQHQLELSTLYAPTAAVVRARLLEPGDIASPQRPLYTLALTAPKWIRVYVDEPDLGRIRPGMAAEVFIDSAPEQAIAGQIGYISSVAEFTPKTVQTENLRTALVYEVRVRVDDVQNQLRLGMPASVRIDLTADASEQSAAGGTQ